MKTIRAVQGTERVKSFSFTEALMFLISPYPAGRNGRGECQNDRAADGRIEDAALPAVVERTAFSVSDL